MEKIHKYLTWYKYILHNTNIHLYLAFCLIHAYTSKHVWYKLTKHSKHTHTHTHTQAHTHFRKECWCRRTDANIRTIIAFRTVTPKTHMHAHTNILVRTHVGLFTGGINIICLSHSFVPSEQSFPMKPGRQPFRQYPVELHVSSGLRHLHGLSHFSP